MVQRQRSFIIIKIRGNSYPKILGLCGTHELTRKECLFKGATLKKAKFGGWISVRIKHPKSQRKFIIL
jgi:hypothetical protein